MIRLLVVDDQPAVRQGLRMRLALEPDITAVGEAGDGITATTALQALAPRTAVVILTLHDDADTRRRAPVAGAEAVVSKRQCTEDLCGVIRQVAAPPEPHEDKPSTI